MHDFQTSNFQNKTDNAKWQALIFWKYLTFLVLVFSTYHCLLKTNIEIVLYIIAPKSPLCSFLLLHILLCKQNLVQFTFELPNKTELAQFSL